MKPSARNAMRLIRRLKNVAYEVGFDVGSGASSLRHRRADFRVMEAEIREMIRIIASPTRAPDQEGTA